MLRITLHFIRRLSALGLLVSAALTAPIDQGVAFAEQRRLAVCENPELLRAIRTIDAACSKEKCNFDDLKRLENEVDKRTLLAVMRNPDLYSVYLFYPTGQVTPESVLDWQTKQVQLKALKNLSNASEAVVYVIGRASAKGKNALNERLARLRAQGILRYLKEEIKIDCHEFHAAWFGEDILYLTMSDASLVVAPPQDYRNREDILNQSAHVFIFPCKSKLGD